MDRKQKESVVEWLRSSTENDETVIFSSFSGLDVTSEGQLRQQMRESGGTYKVIKNTLIKLGLGERAEVEGVSELLQGMTAVSISDDPVSISKALKSFAKENEAVVIKGGLLGNKFLSVKEVEQLAELPSKEELLGKLVGMLQQPITQVASVLQAPMRDLAAVLSQVEQQKS